MMARRDQGLVDAVAIALAVEEARQKGHTMHPTTRVDQLFGGKEYRLKAIAALDAAAKYRDLTN